ncbi:MAG: alpha/beta hydrolase [Acidobacteria bacterium]|nr:MAG: alpha/beta hydrolase [Acidobacteriota bacterium]PYV74640.1 MAG: alpha/beta hydrolase [Acidobacteriota bacterium]
MNPLVGGPFAIGMLWLRTVRARSTGRLSPIIFLLLGLALGPTAAAQIQRQDFLISGGAGRLHVRELRDHRDANAKNLILLHGGGPGGVPSFDLPVPGYSLAEDFAKRGFRIFIMDVRGWGSSTKPRAMDQPPENSAPLVPTKEAADDIATVANWVVRRTHEKTALLGWASGGHWACAYGSRRPAALTAVILLNTLYSVNAPWELRASMQDRNDPEQFDRHAGGYRIVDGSGLLRRWDASIPAADKSQWRDPAVADAYVTQTLATDRTASSRNPPSVRIPIGYQVDAFNLSLGRPVFAAKDIRVPVLIVRGELDFWSRPADVSSLARELVNSARVETLTIKGGTHYLFLNRPDHGRSQFISEVLRFLI